MAKPSFPPPSVALWGGWYANILELSTFDTPEEQQTFLREHALVQALASVEETKNMTDLWTAVRRIPEQTVMQLNSPLLDDLRKVSNAPLLGRCFCSTERYAALAAHGHDLAELIRWNKDASLETVSFCLDRDGAVPSVTNALYWAAMNGRKDICGLLLRNHGLDIRLFDDYPLRWSAATGRKDICELLLDAGVDPRGDDDAALRWAAENGHKDVCVLLLDRGANVNALDGHPLRGAAYWGSRDLCELLLDRGADIHACDNAALRWAIGNGQQDVISLLLSRGANQPSYVVAGSHLLRRSAN